MTEIPGVRSSVASAISFVMRSSTTVTSAVRTNSRRGAPADSECVEDPCPASGEGSTAFAIFLFLFARNAQACVRQCVEPLEVDLLAALMALSELVRRAIQSPEGFVDMPEIAAFLGGEEELLLPLHRIS